MADITSIKYDEVRDGIASIKDENLVKMKNIFRDYEATMKRVGGQDAFVGEASETFQSSATKFSKRFEDFENLVLQFSVEFEKALTSTQRTEEEARREAENLPE